MRKLRHREFSNLPKVTQQAAELGVKPRQSGSLVLRLNRYGVLPNGNRQALHLKVKYPPKTSG